MAMTLLYRLACAGAVLAMCLGGIAAAQENLDKGKTPAQLFASDCAVCHRSPKGLAKSGGLFGLDNFLREHYTASRESASAIAGYLRSLDATPASRPAKRVKSDKKDNSRGAKAADR